MEELKAVPSFGREIRDSWFLLDKETAFTNHGSFGTVPKPVLDVQSVFMRQVDANPDRWYRRLYAPLYFKACEEVEKFIGAPPGTVVLVDNATSAVNIILQSLALTSDDGVLVTVLTYGACDKAARAVCEQTGAKLHIMNITIPIVSKESIVEQYGQYLDEHPDVRFALVDHITSPSSVVMLVKEIVEVCHARGVRVMVDGAHAPGQLEISVPEIGADYYTGNLHKWLFCPRGCALLHVKEEFQSDVYPLVVSHKHFETFLDRFPIQGTSDYTSYCTAPAALEFFHKIGGLPAVVSYNQSLLSWATDYLCRRWGVKPLPIPPDMCSPFLSVVGPLPPSLAPSTEQAKEDLIDRLLDEYNVVGMVGVTEGQVWCRICAQVYNVKDYEKLADAVDDLIKKAS